MLKGLVLALLTLQIFTQLYSVQKLSAACSYTCGYALLIINILAPELFFLILAHPVYKM